MRVRIAASAPPMVIAGRIRWRSEPEPETGSRPSLMANNRIRIGPRAKLGNDRPNRLTTLIRRSSQRLRRWADALRRESKRITATSEASVNCSVYG